MAIFRKKANVYCWIRFFIGSPPAADYDKVRACSHSPLPKMTSLKGAWDG
ncbi:hypothetical protein PAJ34TS1_14730 [Paenibacillus azoreducens]